MRKPEAGARVFILTGPSRAGKTTVCRAVAEAARLRGLTVAGVLTEDGPTESGVAGGGIMRQVVRDLRSDERRLLATAPGEGHGLSVDAAREGSSARPEASPREVPPGSFASHWVFEPEGVEFGRRALDAAAVAGCDLLVVDQIGPLELLDGGGWTDALDVVLAGRHRLALLVVNPRVIHEAEARLAGRPVETLLVDDSTREDLPSVLLAAFPA